MTTHLRRSLALVAGLVAVAAPVLSACGQNAATDRFNVLANAGYDLSNGMHVVGTRIVASSDGQGIFIGAITLNPSVDPATTTKGYDRDHALVGLAAAPDSSETVTPVGAVEKTIDTEGVANLSDPKVGGVPVTGTFKAGDIVPIVLTFADGTKSPVINTPVVTDCFEYAGAGTSTYSLPSADPSPSIAANPGPYDCAYPSVPPIGG